MNKKQVETLIPNAIKAIEEYLLDDKDRTVASEYNGYISSFGASIIQSGLLPTVAFFETEENKSQKDKKRLISAILYLIKGNASKESIKNEKLLEYILKNKEKEDFIKEDIINAAIAIKLSLRTFKFKK